ncbi:MAG: gliding motility lipoprotein GldB [Bacteroidales bacterium]
MMKLNRLILIALMLSVAFFSCRRNQYKVNISGIEVEIRIKRLERALFSIDPLKISDSVESWKTKYGNFLKYFSYVINIGEMDDSLWLDGLVRFCTDRFNNEVYEKIRQVFPDLKWLEKDISGAFRFYRYYFPTKPVPAVYSCITGFNNSIITGDSTLGISLDMYLGSDCRYYPSLGIYNYQAAKMTPSNIITDCMYSWASSEWDYDIMGYKTDNVLSVMIHEGKLLYFVKCMLPNKPDETIFGFTADQLKFCINNEGRMWQYLIENNLLFSTDILTRKKLVGEAPFTTYFSKESPGRAAAWIGFRIVESYMRYNRNTRLEELMNLTDPQEILGSARYSPRVI